MPADSSDEDDSPRVARRLIKPNQRPGARDDDSDSDDGAARRNKPPPRGKKKKARFDDDSDDGKSKAKPQRNDSSSSDDDDARGRARAKKRQASSDERRERAARQRRDKQAAADRKRERDAKNKPRAGREAAAVAAPGTGYCAQARCCNCGEVSGRACARGCVGAGGLCAGAAGAVWPLGIGLAAAGTVPGHSNMPSRGDDDVKALEAAQRKARVAVAPDAALEVMVVGATALPDEPMAVHPMVRMHAVDVETGKYVTRTAPNGLEFGATGQHENVTTTQPFSGGGQQGGKLTTVCPVATRACLLTGEELAPTWDEALVVDEPFLTFFNPNVVLLFELVDFVSASEGLGGHDQHTVAWGFLRPVSHRGHVNVALQTAGGGGGDDGAAVMGDNSTSEDAAHGGAVHVQLYRHRPLRGVAYAQALKRGWLGAGPPFAPPVPDVYLQFMRQTRVKYPSTLTVSARPRRRPRERELVRRRPGTPFEVETHSLKAATVLGTGGAGAAALLGAGGLGAGDGGGALEGPTAGAMRLFRRTRERAERCLLPDRHLCQLPGGKSGANVLSFSHSGHLLAVACCEPGLDGEVFTIRLYDVNSPADDGILRHELRGHRSTVYTLVWTPDDSTLVSGGADGTVLLWDLASFGTRADGTAALSPTKSALKLKLPAKDSKDGKDDDAEEEDDDDAQTAKSAAAGVAGAASAVMHHPCYVYCAALVLSSNDIAGGKSGRGEGGGAGTFADAVGTTPGGGAAPLPPLLALTGAFDGQIRLWEARAGELLGTLRVSAGGGHSSAVQALCYDWRSRRVFSGDNDGTIVVWKRSGDGRSVECYQSSKTFSHPDLAGKGIVDIVLHPTRRRGQLLVAARQNVLYLLDVATLQILVQYHGAVCNLALARVCFSPDGKFVVAGSDSGGLNVWDSQTPSKLKRTALGLVSTKSPVAAVAWHPRQHLLVSASTGAAQPVLAYYAERSARLNDVDASNVGGKSDGAKAGGDAPAADLGGLRGAISSKEDLAMRRMKLKALQARRKEVREELSKRTLADGEDGGAADEQAAAAPAEGRGAGVEETKIEGAAFLGETKERQ